MGPVTISFGVFLIVLGLVGFVPTGAATALIPAGFGVVFLLLGVLARQEKLRMHVMHAAVLLGLIGCIGAVVMVGRALSAEEIQHPRAFWLQVLMAAGCAVFVVLCVKSFIAARRRRRAASPEHAP